MSNKLKKKTNDTGKGKSSKKIILGVATVALILIIFFLFIFLNQRNTNETGLTDQEQKYVPDENRNLIIPKEDIVENVTYIDYGGSHQILIWKDNNDTMHMAFNTCQECFSRGDARYTYSNGVLTCSICGNQLSVSSLTDASWGGCQPVAIPTEYRDDTEDNLILSEKLLNYADDMFDAWENGTFSTSLETYEK